MKKRQVILLKSKNGGPIRFNKTPQRNDKCHCGSELKYKNCCLDRDFQKLIEIKKPG